MLKFLLCFLLVSSAVYAKVEVIDGKIYNVQKDELDINKTREYALKYEKLVSLLEKEKNEYMDRYENLKKEYSQKLSEMRLILYANENPNNDISIIESSKDMVKSKKTNWADSDLLK